MVRAAVWLLVEHGLFGKPVSTFPDHALGSVEIQDSRGSLFVIQAADGTIRFD
jgi:hypothetical protein